MALKSTLLFVAFFCCSMVILGQTRVFPQPTLSASTRLFLWKIKQDKSPSKGIFPEFVYRQNSNQDVFVSALIQVFPEMDEGKLKDLGAQVGTKAGDIWTVQVPVSNVDAFSKLSGIRNIEMDQPSSPDLDSARRRTRVDSVHKGLALSEAYSGKGVVVGIVDAGFDYTHPTLYDTAYQRYRVKRVWEEKGIGTPPSGFSYGAEFADSAAILNRAYDINDGTHGTHVAGIAGGSGYLGPNGNHRRFRGMAYESDLVLVAIYPSAAYWLNTGMADMLDGINYTFQYAASQNKPAVANLSWGCPLGPRDGKSLFSKACNNLVGPGKVFVLSGGNNGQNKIHVGKTFSETDTLLHSFLTFSSSLPQKINQVDVWGDSSRQFCMQFSLYNAGIRSTETPWICLDDSTHSLFLIGANGDTCFITATAVAADINQKPHMLLQFYSRVADQLCLSVKANSGAVHLWQGIVVKTSGYYGTFTRYAYTWATEGNTQMTTGDMVSTHRAIAVAAYNSKINFTNVSGTLLSYTGYQRGRIAAFSSTGPTADGRVKPNIAGPGMALASSVSSVDSSYMEGGADYNSVVSKSVSLANGRTYSYAMAGGTSMSSPAVSGIVALLFQANPLLGPEEIMEIFKQTALKDTYTGVIPAGGSNVWGFGKVNAMGALKQVLEPTGIHHARFSGSVLLYPNPANGSFFLEYLATGSEQIQISVHDLLGRNQLRQINHLQEGSNRIGIDLTNKKPGMYWVTVSSAEGKSTIRVLLK